MQPLKLSFPELFSFAKKPCISLMNAVSIVPSSDSFNLPLSVEAFDQFQKLNIILQDTQPIDAPDVWTYIWGSSIFTSKKAYKQLVGTGLAHPLFKSLLVNISTRFFFSGCL